ncbi:MAG: DAK2 domain-containing protein [Stomatobaculum sp.]|nr:DAK2 domain-containing protein [Stomatobaculum sp.]
MITGAVLRDALISGANRVAEESGEMNRINFFPVADGDTGANLTLTLGMAKQRLLRMPESSTAAEVLRETADVMLRASRGNSGAILSAMIRGMAVYVSHLPEHRDISELSFFRALSEGVDLAFRTVSVPTDGTMLTVARKTARAGLGLLEETKETDMNRIWKETLDTARRALSQTRFEMELLWENDVVDAGALGFVCFFKGMTEVFLGRGIVPEPAAQDVERPYVFDKEKVMKTDGSLPVVTYVLNAEFSGENFIREEVRKRLEPCSERLTLFQFQDRSEAKFNTDDLAAAVKAAAETGCLVKLSGISHSANFKIRFGTLAAGFPEELEQKASAAPGSYGLIMLILKDSPEEKIGEKAVQMLKRYYLEEGRYHVTEERDLLRIAAVTDIPWRIMEEACQGGISRGFVTEILVQHWAT